ncbi:MAG: CDP-glycerol glycerophosphotransferase family protein [Methanobrevibacter sp.]|jgi:hypothetical protein|nr:CDP-glycerol glycerophosphotransferase family protein [Candidatus Methanoflexus mossambicus]
MSKFLEKILSKSNSYNYYKRQYKDLKKENKVLKKDSINYENILKKLEYLKNNLQENNNNSEYILIKNNLQDIREYSKNNEINVIFLAYLNLNIWDSLIHYLQEDRSFNYKIIIIPIYSYIKEGWNKDKEREYNNAIENFKNKGMNIVKGFMEENETFVDITDLNPHIIFYMNPFQGLFPEQFRLKNLPKDILYCYIPYSFYLAANQNNQFNQELHRKAWKFFVESSKNKELSSIYSDTGSSNVVVTGHPKMDSLIDGSYKKSPMIWKNNENDNLKIIWAPHHSIDEKISASPKFSTFHLNCKFFYEYAKKHKEIEWIFKPHPILIHSHGLLNNQDINYETFKKYYKKWDNLPNATVFEGSDYLNVFANSDAMITDSVSFLAEYLYFRKPGLFLTRKGQKFNEFGEIIKEAWYQNPGDNFQGIESFIEDILIERKDSLKENRNAIYDKYLNTNGVTAGYKIYEHLKNNLIIK